jgi:CubicO group peptidase (beta-lactamase class C family)
VTELHEITQALVQQHGIPGAVVGVLDDGRVEAEAAGTANLNTGVEMTPDTLFLTGSITKVWTTTLLMSLVEQGLADLDAPLKRYLPDLVLGSPGVAETLTVRHLVTHTTGLDAADMLAEVGDGDQAISSYIRLLGGVGQLFQPGRYFSYNNAGFVLAGRIIEVVTGEGFSGAMRRRLFAPLDLERSMLTAKEALLHRVAIGHYPGEDGFVPTDRFLMPECWAPAGTTLITTVRDTLAFVQAHLPAPKTGPRLLSRESVERMAAHSIDFPVPATGSCGLSWLRKQHGPRLVLAHGGGSYGGVAMLGVVPDMGAAYIAFANGGSASLPFHRDLAEAILEKRFGLPPQDTPDVSGPTPDPRHYHGVYRQWGAEVQITHGGDALLCRPRFTAPILQHGPEPAPVRLRPAGAQALVLADDPDHPPYAYGVGDDGTGHPEFLFLMDHLARRLSDDE